MNDTEVRIECIKAAASTPGNPNHIKMAREYYAFATEGAQDPIVGIHAGPDGDTVVRASGKKKAAK